MAKPANPQALKDASATMRNLENMQKAALYGVTKDFLDKNEDFIRDIEKQVQQTITQFGNRVGGDIPRYIADVVTNNVKNVRQNQNTSDTEYLKDIKGVTDQTTDMELFNQLHQTLIPTFELFYEYDLIHSMIPEIRRCLEIIKESITSPDDFSKEFLIPRYDEIGMLDETISPQQEKIVDTVKHYKLNERVSHFIEESLRYGCKPIMVIPIDEKFRNSAKRILQTTQESFADNLVEDIFSGGKKVTVEDIIPSIGTFESAVSMESGNVEDAFATLCNDRKNMAFMEATYGLLNLYADALHEEIVMEDNEIKKQNLIKKKDNIRKNAKNKLDLTKNAKQIAQEVADVVNRTVKMSYTAEGASTSVIRKIKHHMQTKQKYTEESNRFKGVSKNIAMEKTNDMDILEEQLMLAMEENALDAINAEANAPNIERKIGQVLVKEPAMSFKVKELPKNVGNKINDAEQSNNKEKSTEIKTGGSIIIPLSPDTVVPVTINGEHVGYYVIERAVSDELAGSGIANMLGCKANRRSPSLGILGHSYAGADVSNSGGAVSGVALREMTDLPNSSTISGYDSKKFALMKKMFIRAISARLGNPDIVEDKAFNSILYSLIREDYITKKEIRVSYVPDHMMVYYAPKIDTDTGIGVSEYQHGLFSAHLYLSNLITNQMIKISKSADREQLKIEVGVHKRIEATVQKAIRMLQTKRIAIGDLSSVDSILKQVGQFQRFVSLMKDGNPMVELDTIPGQNVDMDSDLSEKSLKTAIVSMGVPSSALTFVDDIEFARQLSLQNGMFLRKIVDRQSMFNPCNSKLLRLLTMNRYPNHILNKETSEDPNKDNVDLIDIGRIYLDLPSPTGLNMTTQMEQINTASDYADKIIETVVPPGVEENEDLLKSLLKKNIMKDMLPNVKFSKYEEMYNKCKLAAKEMLTNKVNDADGGV